MSGSSVGRSKMDELLSSKKDEVIIEPLNVLEPSHQSVRLAFDAANQRYTTVYKVENQNRDAHTT